MRWVLVIQYDGYAYRGWQSQKNCKNTIQTQLELALGKIANEIIKVYAAGRTDAGVHAKAQIVHFETNVNRSVTAWILGTNSYLPNDISVVAAHVVANDFHARFNAIGRSYEYVIYNDTARAALLYGRAAWEAKPLNIISMQQAAQYLIGEHNFSSFQGSDCQALSPVKIIKQIDLIRIGAQIKLLISANGFLHHMVRNIVGTLLAIGSGNKPISWIKYVLHAQDRTQAGITAKACGLYFIGANYSTTYNAINTYINKNKQLFWSQNELV